MRGSPWLVRGALQVRRPLRRSQGTSSPLPKIAAASMPSLKPVSGTWPYPMDSESPLLSTRTGSNWLGNAAFVWNVTVGAPAGGGAGGSLPDESSFAGWPRQTELDTIQLSPNRMRSSPWCSNVQPRSVP